MSDRSHVIYEILTHVIYEILNVVNVVRHYLVMERLKECPTAHVQVKRMSAAHVDAVLSRIAVQV